MGGVNWNWQCVLSVFEKFRFRLSTRPRENSVFKKFYSGERFRKVPFSLIVFIRHVWTETLFVKKKLRFQMKTDTCVEGLRPGPHVSVTIFSYPQCSAAHTRERSATNVRCIKMLTWLWGFLIIFLHLVWFSLCSSLFWELRDNGIVKNLHIFPLSLGVMLKF